MKKCKLLITLVLAFALLIAGCGVADNKQETEIQSEKEQNLFVGNWIGTLDLTDYIKAEMKAANPDMEKYLTFEGLALVFQFAFTEEEISISVDEASKQAFAANAKAAVAQMSDAMIADRAAAEAMSVDDLYALMGTNRDAYVNAFLEAMNIDSMADSMAAVFTLSGSYSYNEDMLTISYNDSIYETMQYVFEDGQLVLTASDGVNAFVITCVK